MAEERSEKPNEITNHMDDEQLFMVVKKTYEHIEVIKYQDDK
ncbi:hypothetical protein SAMN04488137_2172 [Fictibacillus solisalsi]|uniref:Uncharacterized protein n=1 Tax=Fictibacillus solisalsi TaxID=459525 RepID=A0A1G9WHT9_9BACL|nr:hypothetical protein [Fictibacillus solisalsi]SDM83813.1 hypothetical protein SAMN04488137_2172 [Fictibacillus solisalsi]